MALAGAGPESKCSALLTRRAAGYRPLSVVVKREIRPIWDRREQILVGPRETQSPASSDHAGKQIRFNLLPFTMQGPLKSGILIPAIYPMCIKNASPYAAFERFHAIGRDNREAPIIRKCPLS